MLENAYAFSLDEMGLESLTPYGKSLSRGNLRSAALLSASGLPFPILSLNSRKAAYYIADNHLDFFLKFCFFNLLKQPFSLNPSSYFSAHLTGSSYMLGKSWVRSLTTHLLERYYKIHEVHWPLLKIITHVDTELFQDPNLLHESKDCFLDESTVKEYLDTFSRLVIENDERLFKPRSVTRLVKILHEALLTDDVRKSNNFWSFVFCEWYLKSDYVYVYNTSYQHDDEVLDFIDSVDGSRVFDNSSVHEELRNYNYDITTPPVLLVTES